MHCKEGDRGKYCKFSKVLKYISQKLGAGVFTELNSSRIQYGYQARVNIMMDLLVFH